MLFGSFSTLGFGIYYYYGKVVSVYSVAFSAFGVFLIITIISFFTERLSGLFRIALFVTVISFYVQIFFTGGIDSPAVFGLITPPLLAFFYRPSVDRYVLFGITPFLILSLYFLSSYGLTENQLPTSMAHSHGIICALFVFSIVMIHTFLFKGAIKSKNNKLLESDKMASLGMLSAGVAHEINNPLNFIKGGVEGLEHGLKSEKKIDANEYFQAIYEGLNRTEQIVNSLKHFSRQSDTMTEICDLHSIIDNCLLMIRPNAEGVQLEKNLDKQKIQIKGNDGKLHQVFLNLLSNAVDAIEDKGNVVVRTVAKNDVVKIVITDNGIGIPKKYLNKIKDPFFTTKPVGKGTGLGLSITSKIIDDHRGIMHIESEIKKGSTFIIVLPRHIGSLESSKDA